MFYLSGNNRGSLLGVKDTKDNVEEFYSKETLRSSGLRIYGLTHALNQGDVFEDEYFIYTYGDPTGLKVELRQKHKGVSYLKPVLRSVIAGVKVRDVSFLFNNCENLVELDLSCFETTYITSFSYFLHRCLNLREVDVSNFDTRSLRYAINMFADCCSLKKLNLSNFKSDCTCDLSGFLHGCGVVELNLNGFACSEKTRYFSTFDSCDQLKFLIVNKDYLKILRYFLFYVTSYIIIDKAEKSVQDLLDEISQYIVLEDNDIHLILTNYELPCSDFDVKYFKDYSSLRSKLLLLNNKESSRTVYIQRGS